jgi:hypothetical protein
MEGEITSEHLEKHVHKRLRNRVRLYLGVSVVLIVVIIYRMLVDGGGFLFPLIALVVGLGIGLLLARMFKVSWDTDAEKVVSRMDIYGTSLLIFYIILEMTGEHYIRQWFTGSEVLTIILALAGGAVLGRGFGMSQSMMRVLRENI